MTKESEVISYLDDLQPNEIKRLRKNAYFSSSFLIVTFLAITICFWYFSVFLFAIVTLMLFLFFILLFIYSAIKMEREIKKGKKLVIQGKIQSKEEDRTFENKFDRQGSVVSSYFIIGEYKIKVPRKEFLKYSRGQSVEIHKLPESSLILKIGNLAIHRNS
ncbi:hypothetical protein CH370_06955 [Leptospira kmetyi]|nr:hypothetical protein CH370_06955 [Leptospira kmetyi]